MRCNLYRWLEECFCCDRRVSWWPRPTCPRRRVRPARVPGLRVTPPLSGRVLNASPRSRKWARPRESWSRTIRAMIRSTFRYVTAFPVRTVSLINGWGKKVFLVSKCTVQKRFWKTKEIPQRAHILKVTVWSFTMHTYLNITFPVSE